MTRPRSRMERYRRAPDELFSQQRDTKCSSMEELGEVLRTRRKERRYTQTEMAEICGFSQRLISEMERGRGTVGIDKVLLYAHWLGVDVIARLR